MTHSSSTAKGVKTPGSRDTFEVELAEFSAMTIESTLTRVGGRATGLSVSEAQKRLKNFGYNVIADHHSPTWFQQLLRSFVFPFNAVLLCIAIISFVTDVWLKPAEQHDYKTIIVLGSMIMLSSLIRFWQEYRSNKAAVALRQIIHTTATVRRENGEHTDIDIKNVVPGDVVILAAGDMIPADCRIIHSKDLFISQSLMTGESSPVEKHQVNTIDATNSSILDLQNICLMGTTVASGAAEAVVLRTGPTTYLASVSAHMGLENQPTSFDKGVNSVSFLLMKFMIVMVPLVFLLNGLTKGDWVEALLFAISVAVGLTPEMLPMIVSTNLARGALQMSRERVIVKRLSAIQNLGAMDVLCTDKTGTLTLDKIVLKKYLNVFGEEDDEVLQWAYLNSYHQTGLRNLLDKAVLEHHELDDVLFAHKKFEKIDEVPFDFQRRRLSVVLRQANGKHLLICKGAVEEMLSVCSRAFDPGEDKRLQIETDVALALDDALRANILQTSRTLNAEGMRVLLVAVREFDARELTYGVTDESDMVMTGFIGFLDPVKPSAPASIKTLLELGVTVKVLTGDNEVVTRKICADVGIEGDQYLLGHDIDNLSDEALNARVDDVHIFAKLSPMQKGRIIRLLQSRGHTVGYMGDGINDAEALTVADVGISVDTAVDIAKESASIILLDKDLHVLQTGVLSGRRTFGNIIKYVKMAASSNFGNMFSMLGASALLPFLPMRPIQILLQNLLYDVSQTSIPWDTVDDEYMKKPRRWEPASIAQFMMFFGPLSSLFDYATFAVLFFVFKANSQEHQALFQSGWFVEGLISQSLIVHMIRTRKIPFIQSWASAPVVALSATIMVIAILIPFSPFALALKMQPLPLAFLPWLVGILLAYCITSQIMKIWFIKRFDRWL